MLLARVFLLRLRHEAPQSQQKNPGEERSDEQSEHENVRTRRLLNNPGHLPGWFAWQRCQV